MARHLSVSLVALVVTLTPVTTSMRAQSSPQNLSEGLNQLQKWYQTSTGTWTSPAAWWNWANSLTVLANYERTLNDSSYDSSLSDTYSNSPAVKAWPDFVNNYYDDMGWWALGWIDAYDATNDSTYLSRAQSLFTTISNGWDTTTCGGGLWWRYNKTTKAYEYKAAIQNELFLDLAAKLANRTTGKASINYLNWAKKEWNWFKVSGMINSSNLINNGLDSTNPNACVNDRKREWTYNQGVILAGLAELYIADHDPSLLPQAAAIANAAMKGLVNSNGKPSHATLMEACRYGVLTPGTEPYGQTGKAHMVDGGRAVGRISAMSAKV